MFNSSLIFTTFILSFFTGLAWYDWMQVETGVMKYWRANITLCIFFSSIILEGKTAGGQRNPIININILLPHKYFSGSYDVCVCSFFKASVTFFVEIAWMLVHCVWLSPGAGSRRSDFQTTESEKKGRGGGWWCRVRACGLRIGQQECRLGWGTIVMC